MSDLEAIRRAFRHAVCCQDFEAHHPEDCEDRTLDEARAALGRLEKSDFWRQVREEGFKGYAAAREQAADDCEAQAKEWAAKAHRAGLRMSVDQHVHASRGRVLMEQAERIRAMKPNKDGG